MLYNIVTYCNVLLQTAATAPYLAYQTHPQQAAQSAVAAAATNRQLCMQNFFIPPGEDNFWWVISATYSL